jgi:error-prone DNA polymerase
MQVAMVAAGFSANEADQLRRAMATFKFTGGVNKFKDKLIQGMIDNGYDEAFANKTFRQLEGFGSYGFPESHAASFALIAYASSWMKCHHPDVFLAAILNAQPMGFYPPHTLVRDAREHGVEVRPIDVNKSEFEATLEETDGEYLAVRLGLGMTFKLSEKDARTLVAARDARPYQGIQEIARRSSIGTGALVRLANANAFASLKLSRRDTQWAIKGLRDTLPLFEAAEQRLKETIPSKSRKRFPFPP